VWFVAGSASGPWTAATNVPAAIYSIPPSSPVHYVTYARIDRYDDDRWVSTTAGYHGTYVNTEGVVVYGTGYVYPAYVGTTIYVTYPVTYGYGGITAWGPYGWAGTSGYIYYQNGPWTGVSRAAAGSNAWTGDQWAKSYGRAYNSTTGTRVDGQRGAVGNVYTGNYAYGRRGVA
jgi:hypothetical protein